MGSISQQNPVRVFVSHAFEPSDDYHRVFEYLESSHNFYYRNCSDPEQRGDRRARQAEGRAAPADRTGRSRDRALGTVRRSTASWIDFQLNCAKGLDKPVIVLETFGVKEKMPVQLEALGDEIIEWNERVDRGRDPPPGASRRHVPLGHDRFQAGLTPQRPRSVVADARSFGRCDALVTRDARRAC